MINTQMAHTYPSKDTSSQQWDHHKSSKPFHNNAFEIIFIYPLQSLKFSIILILQQEYMHTNMNTTDYWQMAREYSVWNAAIAALQFWTADLKAHALSSTIEEEVYTAFF